jgi:hypothetical protein
MNALNEMLYSSPRLVKTTNDGPLSKSRLRRTSIFFLVLGLIGLAPTLLDLSPALQAGGLGLVFPGAGFLSVGGWAILLMPLTYALYMLSLFVWFGTGAIIAPVIVWAGSAIWAGSMLSGSGDANWAPALYIALALVVFRETRKIIKGRKQLSENFKRQAERKKYLPQALTEIDARASDEPTAGTRELTEEQLANLRYSFDRALQPIGQYNGFNKIDQFQTASLRYQFNGLGYCLSTMQCHYTPNFHGYLNDAQRTLISQMLERQVWGYWPLENMWGNFNFNFDPAAKDNIMLTGFYGLQIGLYMSNTGDRRYAEPGSLTFKYSKNREYKHSIHTLIQSIVDNQKEQAFCLYPCEPNWVYTPCNFMAMKALAVYDRLFGTTHFNDIYDQFVDKLDTEFTQLDGSVMALRSNLTGFAIPFPFADEGRSFFFNPINHDRALEAWAFARQEMTYTENGKLKIRLPEKGIDMGNYTKSQAANIQNIMAAAREFGDDELADVALEMLDDEFRKETSDGSIEYKCSNSNNANIARARILRRNDWRNAITQGPSETTLKGPILTDVSYPEVLVAKAYSHTGNDLDLVLYPGNGAGEHPITVERLKPNTPYTFSINGTEKKVQACDSGKITESIQLNGRTAVTVTPQV